MQINWLISIWWGTLVINWLMSPYVESFWTATYFNNLLIRIRTYLCVSRSYNMLLFKSFSLRYFWMSTKLRKISQRINCNFAIDCTWDEDFIDRTINYLQHINVDYVFESFIIIQKYCGGECDKHGSKFHSFGKNLLYFFLLYVCLCFF